MVNEGLPTIGLRVPHFAPPFRSRTIGPRVRPWCLGLALACALTAWAGMARGAVGPETALQDLSGEWKWRTEPGHPRGDRGDTRTGWQSPSYDDTQWATLRIGRDWESQGKSYNGIAWYRKTFRLRAQAGSGDLILELGRPDDGCEVYVNGKSLGVWTFRETVRTVVPREWLNQGGDNVIAVRVWDWYKRGGITGSAFDLRPLPALGSAGAVDAPARLVLGMTTDLPGRTMDAPRWTYGWRDEGTRDTRPQLTTVRGAWHGQDAVALQVAYPNSTEFVDYQLTGQETGAVWNAAGYTFLSFWYRTETLHGDLSIRLSARRNLWKHAAPVWQSLVRIRPGGWTHVVLPLAGFTDPNPNSTRDDAGRLTSTEGVTYLSIGYGNHHLDGPGQVQLADFSVARPPSPEVLYRSLSLDGPWTYRRDRGPAQDARWSIAEPGQRLPKAVADRDGLSFAQRIIVPAAWAHRNLELRLGKANRAVSVYWNGALVHQAKAGEAIEATVPGNRVISAHANDVRLQIAEGATPLEWNGPYSVRPEHTAELRIAAPDQTEAAPPEQFEMGAKPPPEVDMEFSFAGRGSSASLRLDYRIEDCFDRTVAAGEAPLTRQGSMLRARISLDASQTRTLFYGEWFRARVSVRDQDGRVLGAFSLPDGPDRHFKLRYRDRDDLRLASLAAVTDSTPHGNLKLVDVIDASADPDHDPHPYKEGGIRNSWVGRRANTPWENGIHIGHLAGRAYREAGNSQFFAYRIGRGPLVPHRAYLLRILVPDDKTRYVAMDIKAGRNGLGTGYRSLTAAERAPDEPAVSGKWFWYDQIIVNDERTYGYMGPRTTASDNGIWVVFHDIGRVDAAAYDAGPAVAELRLYEIPDDFSTAPSTPNASGRVLMMDWERQPESPPEDVIRYAKLMGMNALAPPIQKWSSQGFWYSMLGFAPASWYKTAPPSEDDRDLYQHWLAATKAYGMTLIPRIEYGGGPQLPRAAWVLGPDGRIDPVGRYARWGANLLHPATLQEMKALIDELIGRHIHDNPQLGGLLWRQRQDRLKCSYGRRDVQLFATETGTSVPEGSDAEIARWASRNPDYARWWQEKRAQFLAELRDHLRRYRTDLVLYYYNWDQDHWGPTPPTLRRTPEDWSELYNVNRAAAYAARRAQRRKAVPAQFYVADLAHNPQPHRNLFPALFAAEPGIRLLAPLSHPYLSRNKNYLDYFRTPDGVAVANVLPYEEKGRWNLQWDDYESSEMTLGPGVRSTRYERDALQFGDADVITTTSYTYGRGWASEFREFTRLFFAKDHDPKH